jgi:outer membrane immunogenic protein
MTLKFIKATVAAAALFAVPLTAQAADMPIKTPYYKGGPVVSYYNWTGFYLGVNAGYGFGTAEWSALPAANSKPHGFLAGGTAGYNWQAGAIVYGLEGDFDWSNVKDSSACVTAAVICTTENTWLATFRGRIGYAFDRWLPDITGGGAYGNVKASASPAIGGLTSASSSQLGWTAGAGIEYAFLGNWTAKFEYLYVDLGSFDTGPAPIVNNVSFKENIVRAGLNYRFSGPVFSRY